MRVSTSNKLPGDTGAAVHGPLSGRESVRGARLNVKKEDPPLLGQGTVGRRWAALGSWVVRLVCWPCCSRLKSQSEEASGQD